MSKMELQLAAKTKMPRCDIRRLPALSQRTYSEAKLPELYNEARLALQNCFRVDEVAEVKCKHEAVAVYAKQIKDKSLLYYAERIKLRAVERLGELLNEIENPKSRWRVAKEAGLNRTSMGECVRIVRDIPSRDRDKLIESSPPSSVSKMVNSCSRYAEDWQLSKGPSSPYKTSLYVRLLQDLAHTQRRLVGWRSLDLAQVVRDIPINRIDESRDLIEKATNFLDELDRHLAARQKSRGGG